jgi:hypothetical protein
MQDDQNSELPPQHLVLLGDSILDNARYMKTIRHKCVLQQFKEVLASPRHQVTLVACDGAKMVDVRTNQLSQIPATTTAAVLSIGGNDGLEALASLRSAPISTVLNFFSTFRARYDTVVAEVLAELPATAARRLALLTIYQPQLDEAGLLVDTTASIGVRFVNSVIHSVAAQRGLCVIDCWTIFSRREDYANAIEPGVPGGHKIVRNVLAWLNELPSQCRIYDSADYEDGFDVATWAHFQTKRMQNDS